MARDHVYHWKHGWIPLTHTAAMSKAKGNREKAAELLADAKSDRAGIHSREHVAKAAIGLRDIPDAKHRADALGDVHSAADRLGAHDVLPKGLQRKGAPAHAVGSKVEARQPGIDQATTGEVVGHDAHGMVRVKYADRHGNDVVGTFNPSHVKASAAADFERRNNAHVVARTRPAPSAADYTAAAEKWKRDNPGKKLAGHEREVNDIADELWRQKRLNGPDTGATPTQVASERERFRRAASHAGQMQALGLDKPAVVEPSSPRTHGGFPEGSHVAYNGRVSDGTGTVEGSRVLDGETFLQVRDHKDGQVYEWSPNHVTATPTTAAPAKPGAKAAATGRAASQQDLVAAKQHNDRAQQLEAQAAAKRAEAERAAGSVGWGDRAAGVLDAKGLKQFHRGHDAALRRYTEAQREAKGLDSKAKLARARADEAARVRLTHDEIKGATHVKDSTGWHEVVRVNGKSVTVKTGYSWNDTIPHDKIHEVRKAPEPVVPTTAPATRARMSISELDFAERSGRMSPQAVEDYMLEHYGWSASTGGMNAGRPKDVSTPEHVQALKVGDYATVSGMSVSEPGVADSSRGKVTGITTQVHAKRGAKTGQEVHVITVQRERGSGMTGARGIAIPTGRTMHRDASGTWQARQATDKLDPFRAAMRQHVKGN